MLEAADAAKTGIARNREPISSHDLSRLPGDYFTSRAARAAVTTQISQMVSTTGELGTPLLSEPAECETLTQVHNIQKFENKDQFSHPSGAGGG